MADFRTRFEVRDTSEPTVFEVVAVPTVDGAVAITVDATDQRVVARMVDGTREEAERGAQMMQDVYDQVRESLDRARGR